MAADRKSDQDSKEEIAKGMAEAGKGEVGKAGGEAAKKGGRGHGADPGKISQGMSEASRDRVGHQGLRRRSQEPDALNGVSLMWVELGDGRSLRLCSRPRSGRA